MTFSVGAWVRVRKLDRSTEYINYQPSPEYSCTDFSLHWGDLIRRSCLSVRWSVGQSIGPSVGQKLSNVVWLPNPELKSVVRLPNRKFNAVVQLPNPKLSNVVGLPNPRSSTVVTTQSMLGNRYWWKNKGLLALYILMLLPSIEIYNDIAVHLCNRVVDFSLTFS